MSTVPPVLHDLHSYEPAVLKQRPEVAELLEQEWLHSAWLPTQHSLMSLHPLFAAQLV